MTAMMRELTFVEANKIEFRERAAPKLEGDNQALVRPIAVSRCDLDYAIARGKAPVAGPFALGHECVGEVTEIGPNVKSVSVGDRVVVPFQISCGECERCKRGHTGSCTAVPRMAAFGLAPFSGTEYGGAISDVIRVPFADAMLVTLPPSLDPTAAAALGDNAIDGFRTVHDALIAHPRASVLVAGGGAPSIGLYSVAAALAMHAQEVVYVDPSPVRAAIAEKLGAKCIQQNCEPSLRAGRFPIVVDATARPEGLRFCLNSTEPEGVLTSVGIYFQEVPMPLFEMYTKGITFVTGRIQTRRDLPIALELFAKGAFDLATIATTIVSWDEAPKAWTENVPKLIVRRD
jgi:threonine dehydrogenase-like Zn-dependent dehydrogenase